MRERTATGKAGSPKGGCITYSLYDGIVSLGQITGRKEDGFTARSPDGKKLGSFPSIRAAADRLSTLAAAGGR